MLQLNQMNPENRTALPGAAFGGFQSRFKPPQMSEGFVDMTIVDFRVGALRPDPIQHLLGKLFCKISSLIFGSLNCPTPRCYLSSFSVYPLSKCCLKKRREIGGGASHRPIWNRAASRCFLSYRYSTTVGIEEEELAWLAWADYFLTSVRILYKESTDINSF